MLKMIIGTEKQGGGQTKEIPTREDPIVPYPDKD